MMIQAFVIGRKEIVDGLRDVRSLVSALVYALMGPVVVGLVSLSVHPGTKGGTTVLAGMMAVFTLVSAFVGGMNVAMDTVAGERERRSLVPLLLNPVRRVDVVIGKWLAVCFFAAAGLAINLAGFAVLIANAGMTPPLRLAPAPVLGLIGLPLLAASLQLLISTTCRAVKEAQTYLSLSVFLPMGAGMFVVFAPPSARGWCGLLPLAGQQLQLEAFLAGGGTPIVQALAVGFLTVALAAVLLLAAAKRLESDEIVYGN